MHILHNIIEALGYFNDLRNIKMSSKGISSDISDNHIAKLIMGYLKEKGLHDTLIAMQLSLGISDRDLGDELKFLQQSTLHGRWDDVLAYIKPFKEKTARYEEVKHRNLAVACTHMTTTLIHIHRLSYLF